jgi:hypothetical protein
MSDFVALPAVHFFGPRQLLPQNPVKLTRAGWIEPIDFYQDVSEALLLHNFSDYKDNTRIAKALVSRLLARGLLSIDDRKRIVPRYISETILRGKSKSKFPISPPIIGVLIDLEQVTSNEGSLETYEVYLESLLAQISRALSALPVVCILFKSSKLELISALPKVAKTFPQLRLGVASEDSEVLDSVFELIQTKVNSLTNKLSYEIFAHTFSISKDPTQGFVEIPKFFSEFEYSYDVGNRHLSPYCAGNSSVPMNQSMKTAYPSVLHRKLLTAFLYRYEIRESIYIATGIRRFKYLNARLYESPDGIPESSGPHLLHFDFNPKGIVRAILYLTDVKGVEDGPFTYMSSDGTENYILGRAGTLTIFDGNTLHHRASRPIGSKRRALDLSIYPVSDDEPEGVYFLGLNTWPSDAGALEYFESYFSRLDK